MAQEIVKDGDYWRRVMSETKRELQEKSDVWQALLDGSGKDLPEAATGQIMATIGQAHLLTDKKFAQYNELCDLSKNNENAELKTHASDLEGFWDVINIQVDDIRHRFAELEGLKARGWQATPEPQTPSKKAHAGATPSQTPVKATAEKQRQEARQRLMEAKRAAKERAMQQKDQPDQNGFLLC